MTTELELKQVLQSTDKIVIFSACSKMKQEVECEARDFYTGQEHKYVKRTVDLLRKRGMVVVWYIISAKYGIVYEDNHLRSYNVTFPRSKLETRKMAEAMGISRDYWNLLSNFSGDVVFHIIGGKYLVALGYPMLVPKDYQLYFFGGTAVSKLVNGSSNVHTVSVNGMNRTAKGKTLLRIVGE